MIFPDDYNIKKSDLNILYYLIIAVALSFFEGLVPKPFPFLRLGLGNIVVLHLILKGDYRNSFYIAMGKVIFSALFLGRLITPIFLMGFSGTLMSYIVMVISSRLPLNVITISALGGLTHNLTQLIVLLLLFGFTINPLLITLAILFGAIMGTINGFIYKKYFHLIDLQLTSI
ncbi:Gx transporter family protein [bacterium]|nr:Gx transporter family protein [bacterium]